MVRATPPAAIAARSRSRRAGWSSGSTDTLAVDGVDLAVPEGAIYGMLGPNGAGKTTTLRMLLGIIDPDEGVRRVLGHERPHDIARLIGYLPEERGLYPSMKAYEAIAFLGALRGVPLAEGRKRAGANCSKSMASAMPPTARSASFRRAWRRPSSCSARWSTSPRLVVLDEPFSGLDALNQGKLERMIRALAADGTTVIFSTHVIAHAERLCEGVAIIAGGKVPYAGSGRRRARPDPGAGPARNRARRRAVARRAARRCARTKATFLALLAARKRDRAAAARADRGRGGHPLAVDRARRACTMPSSPSPAKRRRAR